MPVYSGKNLSFAVRSACDAVKSRLWIASPYVGGWQSVRRVLGRQWWDNSDVDVRLLTDEETRPNGETLRRFEQRGKIRHLRGLHAKIYVFDDRVLLTSANLTCAAFSQRHEVGVLLSASSASAAIKVFEKWWTSNESSPFNTDRLLELLLDRRKHAGEDTNDQLPTLYSLPSAPGDFGSQKFTDLFFDYPRFLDCYRTLAKEYASIQRIWPTVPIYFEIDGFLDYLFHQHPKLPSRPYEDKKLAPRQLTAAATRQQLKVLAREFRRWAIDNEEDGKWRIRNSDSVKRTLGPIRINRLRKDGIREVLQRLQCMNDGRFKKRFLDNNSTPAIRNAWKELLYGAGQLTERMSVCAERLHGFKRSSVQELIGNMEPGKYPLRNANVNAGLRYFGFDVSAH